MFKLKLLGGCRGVKAKVNLPVTARRLQSSLANLVENDDSLSNIIAHDRYGFNVNGVHMRGSILVFRKFTLLWNVQNPVNIAPSNAAIVHMIEPRVDILVIGTGERQLEINPSLYGYFSRKGISVEARSTAHAIALFNLLNQEGRRVAAGLVSREPLSQADTCAYVHGRPVVTQADTRLAAVLAADVDMHRAQGELGITGGQRRQLEAGSSTDSSSSGGSSHGALVSAAALRGGEEPSQPTRHAVSSLAGSALSTVLQQQRIRHGVLSVEVYDGEDDKSTEVTTQPRYGVSQQPPMAGDNTSPQQDAAPVLSVDRRALAEERRRRSQRPETGEDYLDAIADRGSRRSGAGRYGLGKKHTKDP